MALILVPYNNAMRLGQGFNSFTQTICIDNAVVGISDNEDSQPLRPGKGTYAPIADDAEAGSAPVVSDESKKSVNQILDDNTAGVVRYPSQIVTYESKYISKLSELSDTLNVSGSLSIRYGEISGGGSGSYVNTDTFNKSDMNFLITVRVVNQTINVKDQLQFWPVGKKTAKDYNPNTFTSVYGDSFISGFQEGGVFTAVVSIRSLDSSNVNKIAAQAHLALQVGVGSVEAKGDLEKAKSTLNKEAEVNITVNWSGGGQLKEGNERWTIDSLQDVAVKFADLVAACPQRTHAILTKYTALRGYIQWKNDILLQPLDYEIASLYTAELLDVYMGYKTIWKDLHSMLEQLDSGVADLVQANDPAVAIVTPDTPANKTEGEKKGRTLKPFPPTFAGIDEAIGVCRGLMVRIVIENDAITQEPSLAITNSKPAYIRPQLFRQLLPGPPRPPVLNTRITQWATPFGTMTLGGGAKEMHQIRPPFSVAPSLIKSFTKLDLGRESLRQTVWLQDDVVKADYLEVGYYSDSRQDPQQSTVRYGSGVGLLAIEPNDQDIQTGMWEMTPRAATQTSPPKFARVRQTVRFPRAYEEDRPLPSVVAVLSGFDFDSAGPMNIAVNVENVTHSTFDLEFVALDSLRFASASWFAYSPDMGGLKCGVTGAPWTKDPETALLTAPKSSDYSGHISFPRRSFQKPPTIFVGLNGFAMPDDKENLRIEVSSKDVTAKGFNWQSHSWAGTTPTGASITWIAWGQ